MRPVLGCLVSVQAVFATANGCAFQGDDGNDLAVHCLVNISTSVINIWKCFTDEGGVAAHIIGARQVVVVSHLGGMAHDKGRRNQVTSGQIKQTVFHGLAQSLKIDPQRLTGVVLDLVALNK